MANSKQIPKSAMAAFTLLLATHEQQKQQLARDICDELGMPHTSTFDLQAGTVAEPEAPKAPTPDGAAVIPALRRKGKR